MKSGQGARRPPLATIAASNSGPTAQPGGPGLDGKAALGLVGLGVVVHMLRSRRFRERVIVGAIVLGALRGLGQQNRASAFERLSAWNKRQVQLLERQAERQARRLEREAEAPSSAKLNDRPGVLLYRQSLGSAGLELGNRRPPSGEPSPAPQAQRVPAERETGQPGFRY